MLVGVAVGGKTVVRIGSSFDVVTGSLGGLVGDCRSCKILDKSICICESVNTMEEQAGSVFCKLRSTQILVLRECTVVAI